MNETPDGDFQTYKGESGGYIRDNFFGKSAATKLVVKDLSDDQIWRMKRGGHDYRKVYAAYHAATLEPTADRRSCWPRRSRATGWARTSRPATPPTR